MEIETRFDIAERVWILVDGIPYEKTVHQILLKDTSTVVHYVIGKRVIVFEYLFRKWETHYCMDIVHRGQDDVFATKEEALKYWVEKNA